MENRTYVEEFILLGLTDAPGLQVPLFMLFTLIYVITLVGNLGMIALISWDSHLHTPMYFFLSNLSLVDFGYSSIITPKVMAGFLTGNKIISYNGCATQMFFFIAFASIENYLLVVMAYDRQEAVCRPLHYATTMTSRVCAALAVGSYVCGLLDSTIYTFFTFSLSFCRSKVIHHFFCDIPVLLALSCSDTHTTQWVVFLLGGFTALCAILIILKSYLFIFITILRIHSAEGQKKAFSTCASHLSAVCLLYGTVSFIYFKPTSTHFTETDKVVSVFYTMAIPMLNPLVYSLRNKDVKSAFRKATWGQRLS
ncbi:olfactory receptor 5B12-like [Petaurus breviceps papuanus]|uniref:olfactory receptor 5B12-like n=1 Tax=Petaurus breviceps papuanus TaxID=3040969 RepID=UPI0036D963A1